jgi:hypothetical protein
MRKIIVGAQVSLDGVMQAPGGPAEDPTKGFKFGGWAMAYFDPEFGEEIRHVFKTSTAQLPGTTRSCGLILDRDCAGRPSFCSTDSCGCSQRTDTTNGRACCTTYSGPSGSPPRKQPFLGERDGDGAKSEASAA